MRRIAVITIILVAVAAAFSSAPWTMRSRAQSSGPVFRRSAQYLFNTLKHPTGLTIDTQGSTLYIADTGNQVIRSFSGGSLDICGDARRGWIRQWLAQYSSIQHSDRDQGLLHMFLQPMFRDLLPLDKHLCE